MSVSLCDTACTSDKVKGQIVFHIKEFAHQVIEHKLSIQKQVWRSCQSPIATSFTRHGRSSLSAPDAPCSGFHSAFRHFLRSHDRDDCLLLSWTHEGKVSTPELTHGNVNQSPEAQRTRARQIIKVWRQFSSAPLTSVFNRSPRTTQALLLWCWSVRLLDGMRSSHTRPLGKPANTPVSQKKHAAYFHLRMRSGASGFRAQSSRCHWPPGR